MQPIGFKYPINVSLIIIIIITICPIAISSSQDSTCNPDRNARRTIAESDRIINFSSFRQKFNKIYSTLVENLMRQKIFMVNSIQAAVSRVRYLLFKSDYFLSINRLSDWTKEEWRATLIKAKDYQTKRSKLNIRQRRDADENDLNSNHSHMSINENVKLRDKNNVPRTDGATQPIKLGFLRKVEDYYNYRSAIKKNVWLLIQNKRKLPKMKRCPQLNDAVFFDHRRFGCVPPVKNQYDCGSCGYFATTSLYEWAYCRLTGEKIRFSEQYALECGIEIGFNGCDGNDEIQVSKFYQEFGFELNSKYANSAGKVQECAYQWVKGTLKKMGQYHMDNTELKDLSFEQIESQLRYSPVLMTILPGDHFQHYGGGLDDANGCEKSEDLHLLLIVGSGRENGHQYWIMRNSYGESWGEAGYYRMKKDNICYGLEGFGTTLKVLVQNRQMEIIANQTKPINQMDENVRDIYNFFENPEHDDVFLRGKGENKSSDDLEEEKVQV